MPFDSSFISKEGQYISPWSNPTHPEICFPLDSFELLLNDLGWESKAWLDYWIDKKALNLATSYWHPDSKLDWLWGLGLPLLSEVERFLTKEDKSIVIGISALPGSGKSTIGKWIQEAAKELNWALSVISLDDFYLPGLELDNAMKGNPWNVPRGLPGSHSIELMTEIIENWKSTGCLIAPVFDKALRNGLGDRSGWQKSQSKILILEGWFLGCATSSNIENRISYDLLESPLTSSEIEYRLKVQEKLNEYRNIWSLIDRIWHIKPIEFSSTFSWKKEQENQMYKDRGSALRGEKLSSFIRMIQAAIPQESLMNIKSDALIKINKSRNIIWVGKNT